jgi:hypothetical protein
MTGHPWRQTSGRSVFDLVASAAYWLTPSLFCLAVYWLGLTVWFHHDDFAWLGLPLQVHGARDLLRALFEPYAQGTIRFLSERAFFLVFTSIFGIDPLPFRIWVFLTQFGNLVLLSSITGRLTGSRLAGFVAPLLWVAGNGLAVPMSWTSGYNEVLFAFFLLLSFHWLLSYFETGKRRYYAAQWISFLAGFGALELMVVYPALVTILYSIMHLVVAPIPAAGPYAMHFDWRIFRTFATYWSFAMGPARLFGHRFFAVAGTALLTVGILVFVLWKIRRKEWLAIFFLGWYAIVLLPLLPLRDHITDFYLTVPTFGLAMLGAWALCGAGTRACRVGQAPSPAADSLVGLATGGRGRPPRSRGTAPRRIAALFLIAIYLVSNVAVGRGIVRWRYERGQQARNFIAGVLEAHRLHPGKMILLDGATPELFAAVVWDNPFRLYGLHDIYLTPEAGALIQAQPQIGDVGSCVLPPGPTLRALDSNQAVVYDVRGERLRNVTANYLTMVSGTSNRQGAGHVDLANPAFAGQLGSGWYPPENGYRWMEQTANLRLMAPAGWQKLSIIGYAPAQMLATGPVELGVILNTTSFPKVEIVKPDAPFEFTFRPPRQAAAQGEVLVFLKVDRTFTPAGESRRLGAAISTVEIH